MIYHVCKECGATLDPGEKCDCRKEPTAKKSEEVKKS